MAIQYRGPGAPSGVIEASKAVAGAGNALTESISDIGSFLSTQGNRVQSQMNERDVQLASEFNQLVNSYTTPEALQEAISTGVFDDLSSQFFSATTAKQQMDSLNPRFDKLVQDSWIKEERAERRKEWGESKLVRDQNALDRQHTNLTRVWEVNAHNMSESDRMAGNLLNTQLTDMLSPDYIPNQMKSDEVIKTLFKPALDKVSNSESGTAALNQKIREDFILSNGSLDIDAMADYFGNDFATVEAIGRAWSNELERVKTGYNPTNITNQMINETASRIQDPATREVWLNNATRAINGAFTVDPAIKQTVDRAVATMTEGDVTFKNNPYVKLDQALGNKEYYQAFMEGHTGDGGKLSVEDLGVSPAKDIVHQWYWRNFKPSTQGDRSRATVISEVISNGGMIKLNGMDVPITPSVLATYINAKHTENVDESKVKDDLVKLALGRTPEPKNLSNARVNYQKWLGNKAAIEATHTPTQHQDVSNQMRKQLDSRKAEAALIAAYKANSEKLSTNNNFNYDLFQIIQQKTQPGAK